ncbi:DNA-directed RNA polymerase I subunit rpa49 [Extremus antarcticus]|uniref:DNA-directed RNA polymerase I subunit rpa49 n=1 Tax=Extremus antarcticus TaxID=702011 RepID=A0AAJ0DFF2_9PEZI|nr:DNA-directed RNA polymerase I subunit rpa49 [Extremus antarcticus]
MAEKEGKKRKRHSNGVDTPSKKVAFNRSDGARIKVTYNGENGSGPVLVSSPGLTAPDLLFKAYKRPLSTPSTNDVSSDSHELLLHSQKHPRLDYTASPVALDQGLSHYMAIYHPATQQLQVTPAHHLSLRTTLRTENKVHEQRTFLQQRQELGREFGTKKAKKIIADKTVNAITNHDPKGKGRSDDVQDAILQSMPDTITGAPTSEQAASTALASKPIPKPNLAAESVEDVYPFDTLVPPADAKLLHVRDWQEKTKNDAAIDFKHRFPAYRVQDLGKTDQILRLKALKYLQLLLEFHDLLPSSGRNGRKVPKKDVLDAKLASWPPTLVASVRTRFADSTNALTKWHMQNLHAHICALSLFADGWVTDTSNLRDDLRLDAKETVQFFRELGCRIAAPTEGERERWGIKKGQEKSVKVARLRLPLEFPKARSAVRR